MPDQTTHWIAMKLWFHPSLIHKMSPVNIKERIKIIKLYYQHGSFKTLRRQWSKHSKSSAPSKSTVKRIIKKFETTGSVADLPRSGRPHSATCETNINLVKASLEASPQISTRRLSQELKISRTSIQRMLKGLGYKPYIPK
ncbi:hypothetical protein LAZ67_8002213 [Cordylochernes scorpioides]|uniref:DUF4817 domain-containing protein n=1 Tax=Cordylochernes scorpioides TaxID=51811 RepID=A0ABY6KQT5_9ARAC|nr:hypothetical protein LAZ67_8002213 [Cordylochernes scorpioides]